MPTLPTCRPCIAPHEEMPSTPAGPLVPSIHRSRMSRASSIAVLPVPLPLIAVITPVTGSPAADQVADGLITLPMFCPAPDPDWVAPLTPCRMRRPEGGVTIGPAVQNTPGPRLTATPMFASPWMFARSVTPVVSPRSEEH